MTTENHTITGKSFDYLQTFMERLIPCYLLSVNYILYLIFFPRPDLKPVEIEPEVVLRLPETERVNATMLRLDEVGVI